MAEMTDVERLAAFVHRASWEDVSEQARAALKARVLDSLACALGAMDGEPTVKIRHHIDRFGGNPLTTLIGGGRTSPDRAAFYNGALVRYLDFNDVYLAPGESFHPSDNLAPVLAAAEYADADGKRLLTALAVAYQVQIRISEEAPVRRRGFDHVTQGTFSAAAGAAKALDLDLARTANGIAIAATANNALRVTRTGLLSHWKGLAFPDVSRNAVHAVFLASEGITGPLAVFEGNKGWRETISGSWEIDWSKENLEKVLGTDLKEYNSEAHAQSAIEALLSLMAREDVSAKDIDTMQVDTFQVSYDIIGGGEEGNKKIVRTKEEADHSLPYILAVAALDRQLMPAQYAPERIVAPDVQDLLQRVLVTPNDEFTRRFPEEHSNGVTLTLKDGRTVCAERHTYRGFHTTPMSWNDVVAKFNSLGERFLGEPERRELVDLVADLERVRVSDLTRLLAKAHLPQGSNPKLG